MGFLCIRVFPNAVVKSGFSAAEVGSKGVVCCVYVTDGSKKGA